MSNTLTLPCPAKLNLMLRITGQRDDGYHNLQTVFQLLNYGDQLQLQSNESGEILLTPDFPGLPQEENLIYKAAALLKKHSNVSFGAQLHIEKRLPMGGGIGGGSSNAASTLLGLNELWQTNLSIDELAYLGKQLGADVPVFVRGFSAWAEGIGEALTPLNLPKKWFVVLSPDCHVATSKIFSHKRLTRDSSAIKVAAFLERGGENDCQTLVESLFPPVRNAVEWLNQFGRAQLTGTGACVFASFDNEDAAQTVLAKLPDSMTGFVAEAVNQSPLHNVLYSTCRKA